MRILLIGHTGHVGTAVAEALAGEHDVVLASRSSGERVDLTDPSSISTLFQRVGKVDAVVTCTGAVPFKPLEDLTLNDFRAGTDDKVLGQVAVVRIGTGYVRDGGSFTLTSGILAREPIRTGAAASLANGAVESFTMAAAAELPRGLRINCVSASVLAEATSYHPSFPGFVPVPAARVAQAYVKSALGVGTGHVLRVE
jgi:NAD(P)-dependent dehydrogenase (short-subunit alcohol dehydrogenase family)